jgi:hypothetical protein
MNLLRDAVIASQRARPERLTHGGLHVSDVANGCPLAVWNRIHRGLSPRFTPDALAKMQYGKLYEQSVVDAFTWQTGIEPYPPSVVIFHTDGTIDIAPADAFDREPSRYASYDDLVGHPDLAFMLAGVPVVYEIKTTALPKTGPYPPAHRSPEQLREHAYNYILQGCAYAKALRAPTFYVHVSDRATGKVREYEFDTEAEWPAFRARWDMMLAALDPSVPPLAAPPAWTISEGYEKSYLCRSCPADCVNAPPRDTSVAPLPEVLAQPAAA